MKHNRWLPLAIALSAGIGAATAARAETVTTTETTTTYSGVVTEVVPSTSRIVIRSEAEAPKTYVYSKKTVFVDPLGNIVSAETVRGRPVTIHYERAGDAMVVSKVIVAKPANVVTERQEVYREVR